MRHLSQNRTGQILCAFPLSSVSQLLIHDSWRKQLLVSLNFIAAITNGPNVNYFVFFKWLLCTKMVSIYLKANVRRESLCVCTSVRFVHLGVCVRYEEKKLRHATNEDNFRQQSSQRTMLKLGSNSKKGNILHISAFQCHNSLETFNSHEDSFWTHTFFFLSEENSKFPFFMIELEMLVKDGRISFRKWLTTTKCRSCCFFYNSLWTSGIIIIFFWLVRVIFTWQRTKPIVSRYACLCVWTCVFWVYV